MATTSSSIAVIICPARVPNIRDDIIRKLLTIIYIALRMIETRRNTAITEMISMVTGLST